jgi:hypothetical protein
MKRWQVGRAPHSRVLARRREWGRIADAAQSLVQASEI